MQYGIIAMHEGAARLNCLFDIISSLKWRNSELMELRTDGRKFSAKEIICSKNLPRGACGGGAISVLVDERITLEHARIHIRTLCMQA